MNKQEEINIIMAVIEHPAGFDIDLFAGALCIRSHSEGYEVSWEEPSKHAMHTNIPYKDFAELKAAVTFFVDKRHELQLGIDFETELMKDKNE